MATAISPGHAPGDELPELSELEPIHRNGVDAQDGTIVALWVPMPEARRLALQDLAAEPPDDLHVTLVYLTEPPADDATRHELLDVVRDVAAEFDPITATISGIGRFTPPPDADADADTAAPPEDPFYASVDAPNLTDFRQALVASLMDVDFPVDTETHGFTPHITLAYLQTGQPSPVERLEPMTITFRDVTVAIGLQRFAIPFGEGAAQEATMAALRRDTLTTTDITPPSGGGMLAPAQPTGRPRGPGGRGRRPRRKPPELVAFEKDLDDDLYDDVALAYADTLKTLGSYHAERIAAGDRGSLIKVRHGDADTAVHAYLVAREGAVPEVVGVIDAAVGGRYWVPDRLYRHFPPEQAQAFDEEKAAFPEADPWDAAFRAWFERPEAKSPGYRIFRAEPERRYTLGVAYPAAAVDAHGDFATHDELERAAWAYMIERREIGLMHEDGTEGAASVVESYIWPGDSWTAPNGEIIEKGDWLLGAVWSDESWQRVRKGEIVGWSWQGLARKREDTPLPKRKTAETSRRKSVASAQREDIHRE